LRSLFSPSAAWKAAASEMETSYLRAFLVLIQQDSRLYVPVIGLLILATWRFYTFTFLPWVYPKDPKEYPYWIPVIGKKRPYQTVAISQR
jgi:hypothetical protein